jgi:hypothetical protein
MSIGLLAHSKQRNMREEKQTADRLAAYSDAVFAVIVTIMGLELRAPDQAAFSALWPLWPTGVSYVVSFLFIAIMGSVQIAMIAGLSYTAVREAILTHPTLIQGLNFLFAAAPNKSMRLADQRGTARSSKKETRVVASEFATNKNGKGF